MDRKILMPAVLLILLHFSLIAAASTLDPLRGLRSDISVMDDITRFAVLAVSIVVLAVSLLAYSRSKSKRILIVSVAFFLFALKLLLKVVDIFMTPGDFLTDPVENVFELLILLLLAVAIFKK